MWDRIPVYCRGLGLGLGMGIEAPANRAQPLVLRSSRITVPKCPHGHHGAHQVKVRVGGRGFPLVVAHGYTSQSRVYLLVLGLLARWFKVIAIDLAGHGGTDHLPRGRRRMASYADLMLCTLHQLGVTKAVFVGHSLGGRVAAEAVSREPDMAAALILANSITGQPWDTTNKLNPARTLSIIHRLVADSVRMMRNVTDTDQSGSLWALSLNSYQAHVRAPHRLIAPGLAILTAAPSEHILRTIGESRIYTVVVYGDADPVVTLADAHSTSDLTGGKLIVVHQSGHCWPLEDRRTLPQIVESELVDGLGDCLDRAVAAAGLDPASASKADLEGALYHADAPIHQLTPPLHLWTRGGPPSSKPHVRWKHSLTPGTAAGQR